MQVCIFVVPTLHLSVYFAYTFQSTSVLVSYAYKIGDHVREKSYVLIKTPMLHRLTIAYKLNFYTLLFLLRLSITSSIWSFSPPHRHIQINSIPLCLFSIYFVSVNFVQLVCLQMIIWCYYIVLLSNFWRQYLVVAIELLDSIAN